MRATIGFKFRREISFEHIDNPSVQQPAGEVLCLDTSPAWRDPIIAYLKDETLPDDMTEIQKLQYLATRYTLLRNTLYKKSYSSLHSDPYLKCLGPDEARKVMQEIQDGDCGNHVGARSLAQKVINQGYYWPKMFDDAKYYVKMCSQCQKFTPVSNRPSTDIHTLRSLWPFIQWGLDVVRPLPRAQP